MSTRGLVVACDSYPNLPGASRRGAVAAALAFRQWLLCSGGVRLGNLRFLASCSSAGAQIPAGVTVDGMADTPCFTREVEELVTERSADRLYVYVAGHGCRTDPDNPYLAQDVLVLGDFDPRTPQTACVAVQELAIQLAQGDHDAIVLILDCCRGFPYTQPIQLSGFGRTWPGRRRSGAAVRFQLQATGDHRTVSAGTVVAPARVTADTVSEGSFTRVLLDGLAGAGVARVFDETDDTGLPYQVRWSSLERYLHSALRQSPPKTSGQNPGMVFARFRDDQLVGGPEAAGGPSRNPSGPGLDRCPGEFAVRSADPNAMVTIEDTSGARKAVGVGSIEGSLPAGAYTAVLADPMGVDPRICLDIAGGQVTDVAIDPNERPDGFRVTDVGPLRWSSPAAQLAAATTAIWAHGHRSYLLVGGTAEVPHPDRVMAGKTERFEHAGALFADECGWWVALLVRGPWRSIQLSGHRITVPAAPDSVSALAVTGSVMSVALFDTTHADPDRIAAQDRVQEYLSVGQLGAADLTSRLAVEAGERWPWGATATVRRLIDRIRLARLADAGEPREGAADASTAGCHPESGDPPADFVSNVPPDQRHRLAGHGPWAIWLDWGTDSRSS